MKTRLLTGLLCGAALLLGAEDAIRFRSKGSLEIDHTLSGGVVHYSAGWKNLTRQLHDDALTISSQKEEGDTLLIQGDWKLRNAAQRMKFESAFTRLGENDFRLRYRMTAATPVPTASLSIQLNIPAWLLAGKSLQIDNAPFALPAKSGKEFTLCTRPDVRCIEIPLKTGIVFLESAAPVKIQLLDARWFKIDEFQLRINFWNCTELRDSSLELRVRFEPYRTDPIDLRSAANSRFDDNRADDRSGGWTDQGPENDLRALPAGKLQRPPVAFEILNADANQGRSCIVLGGGRRAWMPRTATCAADGKPLKKLFLLHALAWPPVDKAVIGEIDVRHTDGTHTILPVTFGTDLANWWNPYPLANGRVAWQSERAGHTVGLFSSEFTLPGKPAAEITLRSNGKSVWMIAAISGAERPVPMTPHAATFYIQRDNQWRAFAPERHIEPGSALDFAFLLDAPAGKYGAVKVEGNHFCFENNPKPIRFLGTNLCYSANFPTQPVAAQLARDLAGAGYNAARLHHLEPELVKIDRQDQVVLHADKLDRLDFLIAELRKNGIYYTLDLFTDRRIKPGQYPAFPRLNNADEYKLAAMIVPEIRDNLKRFAEALLTHRNPYTGTVIGSDPALIGLSILNENTLHFLLEACADSAIRKHYDAQFKQWATAQHTPADEAAFRRFLDETYNRYFQDMKQFLRGLGVRAPITDQNHRASPWLADTRMQYDYIDNHTYWDHPVYLGRKWTPPAAYRNRSVISNRLSPPNSLTASRIFGKPFTVTEFNSCAPNRFRAEGGVIFPAVAALQDWNAIYRFGYSASIWNYIDRTELATFDQVNDPVRHIGERFSAAFFLRGDVTPLANAIVLGIPAGNRTPELRKHPAQYEALSLTAQLGSAVFRPNGAWLLPLPRHTQALCFLTPARPENPLKLPVFSAQTDHLDAELRKQGLLSAAEWNAAADTRQSPDGQCRVDYRTCTFAVETAHSEAFVLPQGETGTGRFLTVYAEKGFAVGGAIAVDGRKLTESRRILLPHLTNVINEGTEFASDEMKIVLKSNKSGALLAAHGTAEYTFRSDAADWTLYALSPGGKRLASLPLRREGKLFRFRADNFQLPGNVIFAYELVR